MATDDQAGRWLSYTWLDSDVQSDIARLTFAASAPLVEPLDEL